MVGKIAWNIFCKNPDMKHNHRRKKLSLGADDEMDTPGVKGMGIG